jgi:hypothetical protein
MFPKPDLTQPLRISPNGRYFVDAAGQPFFWMADTAWPLFVHYPLEIARLYLEDRARRGFTVIQAVLAWGAPNPEISLEGNLPEANPSGHLPWSGSPSQPNPAFFADVEKIVDFGAQLGLVFALVPTWGFNVNNAHLFDESSAYDYARWVGARFKDKGNIVYMNGGDREPLGYEPIWRALGQGYKDGAQGRHLVTYHPCGWRSSSYYWHNEPWLDFNMIETWTEWPGVYASIAADRALDPAKPVVLGEGAYEDGPEYPRGPITPLIARRQAWWAFLAGGFYTFGQNQMWRMEPGWTESFASPGARQMTIFRQLTESRSWWQAVPDQTLFASAPASEQTFNAALRGLDRSWAMLYIASASHVRINLDRIATRHVRLTWVNPASGERQDGGVFATGNQTEANFPLWTAMWFATPAFWEDAVLLLDGVD